MSKGPGRIERAIADAFAANTNGILSVDDLVSVAYRGINRVEKKHRVATIRAANKVAARMGWACQQAEMPGHPLVYYNPYDVRSYTIGTVVRHGHVRTWQGAVWQTINAWFEAACTDPDDYRLSNPDRTLADMQPGGAWHDHVQINIAVRDGVEVDPDVTARMDRLARLYRAMQRSAA
jgi:hypothetical protein